MPTRKYPYFLEPLDERTKSEFAKNLATADELNNVPDNAGTSRNVWGASALVLDSFLRNKKKLKLKFNAYSRDDDGRMKPYPEK